MPPIPRFLIVDDNADARSLLARTLIRKFPQSLVTECGDADTAILTARAEKLAAIIVHRAGEMTGIELLPHLRKVAPDTPIIYVSGIDRSRQAMEAGATAFLNYDAWLGLGTLVARLMDPSAPPSASASPLPPAQPLRAASESSRQIGRE
ncbi:MAG: response regulator [Verrucomicrobiota bacterium]